MNNLSIRHLRAFYAVAQDGSFTRAAESLHLTQSTLTATIKQLEEQVGLTLFDRTTRSVLLSSEGKRFLPVAERLLSDFDTALADLRAVSEQQQGQVGIAASPSTISRLLPPIVNQYRQQYSNIGIYLRDDGAGGIETRILENEVDFGVASNHSSNPDLSYQPLLRDRYGVVCRPDHPFAVHTDGVCWEDLAHQQIIYLTTDTGIRVQLSRFKKEGVVDLDLEGPVIEASNPAAIAALVSEGMGISLLPALAAATTAFEGLCFIPLTQPAISREICLIRRKGRSLTPAAAHMSALITAEFKQMQLPPFVEKI